MQKILALFTILFVSLGLMIHDTYAARFGGGKSFGMQRSMSHFSRPQQTLPITRPSPTTAQKWLGPLAGLAAGGLLASLLMHHGVGNGLLSWVLVLVGGLLLWNLLRSRSKPQPESAHQFNSHLEVQPSPFQTNPPYHTSAPLQYPIGFNPTEFLRYAKVQFIRLQAAYDSKNLTDLREFTGPEVFGEIQLQLQERGNIANTTEIIDLNAELLEVTPEFQMLVASVLFSGNSRENNADNVTHFNEIWHFQKDIYSSKWLVTGIQQQ